MADGSPIAPEDLEFYERWAKRHAEYAAAGVSLYPGAMTRVESGPASAEAITFTPIESGLLAEAEIDGKPWSMKALWSRGNTNNAISHSDLAENLTRAYQRAAGLCRHARPWGRCDSFACKLRPYNAVVSALCRLND